MSFQVPDIVVQVLVIVVQVLVIEVQVPVIGNGERVWRFQVRVR